MQDAAIGGEFNDLMFPWGKARTHPAGLMLLQYARNGCLVNVGRVWTKDEIMAAAHRGPYVSALLPDVIAMMHVEAQAKVEEGFAEIIYLDGIEYLLGSEE